MFSILKESSPSPGRFGSGFYISCWEWVEKDVVETITEFFRGAPLPKFYSASHIVPILKWKNPTGFESFRLISLCSVIYKLCSKIIVKRLSPILGGLISPEQGAFLSGNVFIKVDMVKAYDSIDCEFLLHVMRRFSFSREFCGVINQCISSPWFLVAMNGTTEGLFPCGRGL